MHASTSGLLVSCHKTKRVKVPPVVYVASDLTLIETLDLPNVDAGHQGTIVNVVNADEFNQFTQDIRFIGLIAARPIGCKSRVLSMYIARILVVLCRVVEGGLQFHSPLLDTFVQGQYGASIISWS